MSRYWFPKSYAGAVQRMRVPGGFLLLAAYLLLASPTAMSIVIGLPVSLVGIALRTWAAGHLRKDTQLTASGPYAHTRNPLYLGTVLAAGGLVIAARSPVVAAIYAVVFLLVYLPVIELEEQYIAQLFPDAFPAWAAQVPRLGWRWRPYRKTPRFSWDLYRRNKEYKAALAVAVAASFLLVRISLAG